MEIDFTTLAQSLPVYFLQISLCRLIIFKSISTVTTINFPILTRIYFIWNISVHFLTSMNNSFPPLII